MKEWSTTYPQLKWTGYMTDYFDSLAAQARGNPQILYKISKFYINWFSFNISRFAGGALVKQCVDLRKNFSQVCYKTSKISIECVWWWKNQTFEYKLSKINLVIQIPNERPPNNTLKYSLDLVNRNYRPEGYAKIEIMYYLICLFIFDFLENLYDLHRINRMQSLWLLQIPLRLGFMNSTEQHILKRLKTFLS